MPFIGSLAFLVLGNSIFGIMLMLSMVRNGSVSKVSSIMFLVPAVGALIAWPVAGETPLLKSFMGEDPPEIRAKFLSTIPMGRFSTPEDMGNAACYLCSDEASMITGVCMEVDGGRCI